VEDALLRQSPSAEHFTVLRGETVAAMTVRLFMPPDVTRDIYTKIFGIQMH